MSERIVSRLNLEEFVRRISAKRTLVGPVADRTGVRFDEIEDPATLRFDGGRATLSPKGIVFPQVETLLRFSPTGLQDTANDAGAIILFGVRPCDARALTLLDRVFRWDGIDDPYYVARRENTTVVSLACSSPGTTCFCNSVGGGPADTQGSDLLLFDLEERFLLVPVTERGEAILVDAEGTTEPASETDLAASATQAENAMAKLEDVEVPTDLDALKATFDAPIWEEIGATCLGCGVCTYSCPTCHCFDITDEARNGNGHRVRSWDSCAFSLFTLHGSGHNPRETQAARLRQRILHKFLYCPENFGETFCVGCGRCVTHCPTGIDLRDVLKRLSSVASAAGGGD